MTLTCSSCHEEVPEGAKECPHCGAGLHTVMFGKGRGLTRTLIGKAIELRDSIPWATASAVVMVRDEGGKPKPRPKGIAGVALGFALFALGAYFLFRSPSKPAEPVVAEARPPSSPAKPESPPAPETQPPAVAAAPARSSPAKPEAPAPTHVTA
ncbi:MAG TPA: zinc ribbon domain-containing protein, partial [Myxococcaceae bacterium]|nr:zinc ribbon domain-containing protein [Myxococcaceae bacterium]